MRTRRKSVVVVFHSRNLTRVTLRGWGHLSDMERLHRVYSTQIQSRSHKHAQIPASLDKHTFQRLIRPGQPRSSCCVMALAAFFSCPETVLDDDSSRVAVKLACCCLLQPFEPVKKQKLKKKKKWPTKGNKGPQKCSRRKAYSGFFCFDIVFDGINLITALGACIAHSKPKPNPQEGNCPPKPPTAQLLFGRKEGSAR